MVFSQIEYSSAKKFKSKHSIRKRTQKIRFESPILPAQVQQLATVLAGVEKTNLRRGISKSFRNFENFGGAIEDCSRDRKIRDIEIQDTDSFLL